MQKKIKVTCASCKKEFNSDKIHINKFRRRDGLTELFYLCPKCKKRYVVCVHNDETLALQKQINKLDLDGKDKEAREIRLVLKQELDKLNPHL